MNFELFGKTITLKASHHYQNLNALVLIDFEVLFAFDYFTQQSDMSPRQLGLKGEQITLHYAGAAVVAVVVVEHLHRDLKVVGLFLFLFLLIYTHCLKIQGFLTFFSSFF